MTTMDQPTVQQPARRAVRPFLNRASGSNFSFVVINCNCGSPVSVRSAAHLPVACLRCGRVIGGSCIPFDRAQRCAVSLSRGN